jgi:2-polyprenyl-3-methyl-5-hydroxy-6-metoxy-1,4-benzoquinol methylase
VSQSPKLDAEAEAFNERISERKSAGYLPDLRRAVKCEYFYKSFWRDPYFARLYVGGNLDMILGLLGDHGRPGMRIVDIGCGPGYYSLELARNGYHVKGVDIADKAIATAKETLASSPREPSFGSLEYEVNSIEGVSGLYDAVLFTGVIHHFSDPDRVIDQALKLIPSGGLVICFEPCHERWRRTDAAIVALIRGILSATGHWYEPEVATQLRGPHGWEAFAADIHEEYQTEKDKTERGQSPNDNASSGDLILASLRSKLVELEYTNWFSFIYRLLGGLRGPDSVVHPLAEIITQFDRFAVEQGHMQPNTFFWVGRKP